VGFANAGGAGGRRFGWAAGAPGGSLRPGGVCAVAGGSAFGCAAGAPPGPRRLLTGGGHLRRRGQQQGIGEALPVAGVAAGQRLSGCRRRRWGGGLEKVCACAGAGGWERLTGRLR
jgi:hypothetical protein